jgi:hypothetical protein
MELNERKKNKQIRESKYSHGKSKAGGAMEVH